MSLKTVVGTGLTVCVFIWGSILLLGFVNEQFSPYLYFLSVATGLLVTVYFLRRLFESKAMLGFVILVILIVSLSLSLLVSATDSYLRATTASADKGYTLQGDIEDLQSANTQYGDQIKDLQTRIADTRTRTQALLTQAQELVSRGAPQAAPAPTSTPVAVVPTLTPEPTPTPEEYIYEDYKEYDEREEDD